jgi:peptidoglycan/xylan/chitin deacetylase (PgdA/CDA1 family)
LAITFDDAFASVIQYAVPILSRHGIPATVFAPTSFMDGHVPLEWPGVDHWQRTENAGEMRAMDWDDLRGLADAGWEIGSHTCSHPHLTTLDPASLKRELNESKSVCSERLGRECRSIAYPYGDINPMVIAAAADAGYETGARLSSDLGLAGPHSFPRVGIYNGDQWSRFRLKVANPVRRIRATRMYSQQLQRRAASA